MLTKILKTSVSLILLGWLLSHIDLPTTWHLFQNFDLIYLIPALLLSLSGILLSVYKWSAILKSIGHNAPFESLLRILWIGLFFNNFLPGRTGGDLVRLYSLSQMIQNGLRATLSIVLDRGLNLIALIAIGALAFYPNATLWTIHWSQTYTVWGLLVVLSSCSFLLLPRIKTFIQKQMQEVYRALKSITAIQMVFILALALLYQTTMILSHVFIATGLGQKVATAHFFYLIPLTALTTLLPISLNGLGVREGTFVLAFTQVGMTSENAVALSLFATLLTMLVSLIGGIFYARNPLTHSHAMTPHKDRVITC